jgi:hypothetical protein
LVHTPGWHTPYTLLVGTHSWLAHTPGWYTLLVGTHSWLGTSPDQHMLLVRTHSYSWFEHASG